MITAMLRKRMSVATTMAVSCSGWFGMRRLSPSPPPLIMNHFSLESGAKPPDPGLPDPAKGGKAVRRPRTVSEPESEKQSGARPDLDAGHACPGNFFSSFAKM